MKMIKIIRCTDPSYWYADKVGQLLPYVSTTWDWLWSREPAGYINSIRHQDAKVIEVGYDDFDVYTGELNAPNNQCDDLSN